MPEGAERAATQDAEQYSQSLADALTAHQAAIQPVGELIVRLEESPSLVTDTTWRESVGAALHGLEAAGTALANLPPPSDAIPTPAAYSFRRAQKLLQEMGRETRALAEEWQRAVAAGDTAAVQLPRLRLHRIAGARQKAMRQMGRARASRPG